MRNRLAPMVKVGPLSEEPHLGASGTSALRVNTLLRRARFALNRSNSSACSLESEELRRMPFRTDPPLLAATLAVSPPTP
mmetsp:Transcript_16089/g.48883  ORF Transcript_16089/g.48883 Transcript_16089/m.48883 type:complete len:80 (+) Transcript_16089:798-1037(+)